MTRRALILLLAALVLTGLAASVLVGRVWVPFDLWLSDDPRALIIAELRLPRALLGAAIGAMLGLSGATLQGYLRNPLADPSILGVSASAALGAVAAIFLGFGASLWAVATSAMGFALGAMLLLVVLVGRAGTATSFVLAGTVISSLAGSLTALLLSLSPNPFAAADIVNWLLGALTDRGFAELGLALPPMALGAALLLPTARALDALSLGEDAARSLGVALGRVQWRIVVGTGLGIGAAVAVTGIVGFVGLVVPHLLRPWTGQSPSRLLLPSALGGAALVLAADVAVRLSPGGAELRLGVAMSLIGAPFFLLLLWRNRRALP